MYYQNDPKVSQFCIEPLAHILPFLFPHFSFSFLSFCSLLFFSFPSLSRFPSLLLPFPVFLPFSFPFPFPFPFSFLSLPFPSFPFFFTFLWFSSLALRSFDLIPWKLHTCLAKCLQFIIHHTIMFNPCLCLYIVYLCILWFCNVYQCFGCRVYHIQQIDNGCSIIWNRCLS